MKANGWQERQLGELAELRGRIGWRGLTAKEYKKEGPLFLSVHSLNYGDYVDFRDAFHISQERYDESPEIILREGDVLICKDGAGIGKLGIVGKLPSETTINSSLLLIRSSKQILPKFLYHCLCSPYFQDIVQSRLQGATTPHLYQRDITEFPVVLPPLPEQQRIVGILDEAFAGIATAKANAEKNLRNARELFESYTTDVFSRRGYGWVEKQLVNVCSLFFDSAHRTPKYQKDGIAALRPRDVVNGVIDIDGAAKVSQSEYEIQSKRYKPREGDIVYSRELSLGWAAIVPPSMVVCLSQGMCIFRTTDEIGAEYLTFVLNSPFGRAQATKAAVGTAHPHINLGNIKSYEIPIPPSRLRPKVLGEIRGLHVETQRLESLYQQKLAALDALKKSLLHQAFSGQLRGGKRAALETVDV